MIQPLWKTVWRFLKKLEVELTYDPAIPLLGIYPEKTIIQKDTWSGELQDGGRVRRGDHLPPHKYIRNTSTCGTTPIEHLLNAGRRPQTSQKARNSSRTWVGQKKKENTETKE